MPLTPDPYRADRAEYLAHLYRYTKIFFDAAQDAQAELLAQGKVKRHYTLNDERDADREAKADGRIVGDYAARLIGQRCADEGLPFEVLTTDRVRAAYLERLSLSASSAARPAESYVAPGSAAA